MPVTIDTLKEGDGTTFPKAGQTVTCHYVLTLQNGKEVDSSRSRGKPFQFKIGRGEVIKGWDEGVAKMSVGQRAKLTISPDLGYGSRGIPGAIPANSTLLFDVELLSVQETPNPSTYKFLPGRDVMGKSRGTLNFDSIKAAKQSPLAMKLMLINGVKNVFFGEDYVSVTKANEDEDWAVLKPEIFAVLMDYLQTEKPIVNEGEMPNGPKDTEVQPDDDEAVAMIKELIECRVKPMVQEDGGDVVYRGFRDGVVYLKLQGSCTGCPSSSVTLQAGIKNMLQFYVPDVVDVVEETDEVSTKAFDDLEDMIRAKPKPSVS